MRCPLRIRSVATPGTQYRGDLILARDDRAVTERAADVGDDAGRHREQRRPGGRRDLGDEDVALTHLVKFTGADG